MAAFRLVRRAILVILLAWFAARYAEGSAIPNATGPEIRGAIVTLDFSAGGPPPCKFSGLAVSP